MLLSEEYKLREENFHLQQQLHLERERREALSRQLSESESSLEMDEETRQNLDIPGASFMGGLVPPTTGSYISNVAVRPRTVSSPIPYSIPGARPISPGLGALATHSMGAQSSIAFTPPSPLNRGNVLGHQSLKTNALNQFVKPSPPPSPKSKQMHDAQS